MSLFGNLPVELIHHILLLEGSLKDRNGKWMNQIKITKENEESLNKCVERKFKSIFNDLKMVFWVKRIPNTEKYFNLYIERMGGYSFCTLKGSLHGYGIEN